MEWCSALASLIPRSFICCHHTSSFEISSLIILTYGASAIIVATRLLEDICFRKTFQIFHCLRNILVHLVCWSLLWQFHLCKRMGSSSYTILGYRVNRIALLPYYLQASVNSVMFFKAAVMESFNHIPNLLHQDSPWGISHSEYAVNCIVGSSLLLIEHFWRYPAIAVCVHSLSTTVSIICSAIILFVVSVLSFSSNAWVVTICNSCPSWQTFHSVPFLLTWSISDFRGFWVMIRQSFFKCPSLPHLKKCSFSPGYQALTIFWSFHSILWNHLLLH